MQWLMGEADIAVSHVTLPLMAHGPQSSLCMAFAWAYTPCPLLIQRHSFSPERAADRLVRRGHLRTEEGTRTWYHHHNPVLEERAMSQVAGSLVLQTQGDKRTLAHGHCLGFHAPECDPKKDFYKEVVVWP